MTVLPVERIIRVIRKRKVILDVDLANLYGVKAIALRQQVKRNLDRFPSDFMFRLSEDEVDSLVSQFVIPSRKHLGGTLPLVFTQEGVAMLSSVLRSPRAVQMNIALCTYARDDRQQQGFSHPHRKTGRQSRQNRLYYRNSGRGY
jgi:hypothetical protein